MPQTEISQSAQQPLQRTQRTAQMEIMGLAIIIILVVLGVLFTITIVLSPQRDVQGIIRESIIANNFLSTYLDTQVPDCFDSSIRELLKDCALGGNLQCPDARDSCAEIQFVTKIILDASLNTWKRDYRLNITGSEKLVPLNVKKGACKGEKESSKQYPIPVKPGMVITLRLELCQ